MNIYALSSGRGPSGIAIVRISGKDTLKVCKNLTKLKEINSNEVNYCKFYDPKNNFVIDPEALLLWFPGPMSIRSLRSLDYVVVSSLQVTITYII